MLFIFDVGPLSIKGRVQKTFSQNQSVNMGGVFDGAPMLLLLLVKLTGLSLYTFTCLYVCFPVFLFVCQCFCVMEEVHTWRQEGGGRGGVRATVLPKLAPIHHTSTFAANKMS